MPYQVQMGNQIIGTMGPDGKVNYDHEKIREIIAGQSNSSSGRGKTSGLLTSVKVIYKWDRNRQANNDAVYALWKKNPIIQNRIRQLNALTFGRGFKYAYDDATKQIVDRCWRINRLRQKLNPMGTDSQLYGETFIALLPQKTGDVLVAIYESNQVHIDFDPGNVDNVRQYIVGYKDEEKNADQQLTFMPIAMYLNNLEMSSPVGKAVTKVRNSLGLGKTTLGGGFAGVMIHIKFNNGSAEVNGTSDFRQVYGTINEYMDFRSDRMAIHQLYGSPMFDIEIDTDDPKVISDRIDELAGFTIGSNPVHNASEKWTPLEFKNNADSAEHDEKAMRGLICSGTGFPEHLLFNQGSGDDGGTFALNKLAEDRQDAFADAFIDMHKFIVAVAGGDITKVDEGQIIFPEISTMSEKAKAETYVLKVGAQMCSRETASYNTGHNWDVEFPRIIDEDQYFGVMGGTQNNFGGGGSGDPNNPNDPNGGPGTGPSSKTANAGRMGGRFSSRLNNQDPNRDTGANDRKARAEARNTTTQVMGGRKQGH